MLNRQPGHGIQYHSDEVECRGDWIPAVDVKETSENLYLFAEVPGLRKEDVTLSVRDKVLFLTGEKVASETSPDENSHRQERVYGKFCRRFALPALVDVTKINAELVDGVLKVTLPKQEQAKAQEIKIS
jgi:HSP20 family protein